MAGRYPHLLSPAKAGDLSLPNRMLMSPMTRFRVTLDGVPTDLNKIYYGQRASAGLIISEGTIVEPMGRHTPRSAGLYTDEQVRAWAAIVDEVHARGGRMFVQLYHGGRSSHPRILPGNALPVAPSAVGYDGKVRIIEDELQGVVKVDPVVPRALETREVPAIVESFRRATERAIDAGFDGVELHAASGLLHHQFLAPCTNRRTDRYGGSAVNRCRFVLETLEAMCSVRGPGRVGIKIAPNVGYSGMTIDEPDLSETFSLLGREVSRFGLAYLHVQVPMESLWVGPRDFDPVGFMRKHYRGTLAAAGQFDRHTGEAAIATGRCDLVVYGRRFIANPDLPERFRRDAEENTWDEATVYGPSPEGFIDYPALAESRPRAAARGEH